jgi:putative ABC transport system ATP-binding protein
MTPADSVFELDQVERARAGAPLVGPQSLSVQRGGVCALLGPSGSGKSTLLALLAGVESADRGRVLWNGRDVTRASESTLALLRRGSIGILGQSFLLLEHLPVWRGVAIGLAARGFGLRLQKQQALAELAALGIDARCAERLPAQLSGGERQRAALARALLSSEIGLIGDEPTSNQDADSAELVVNALLGRVARGCALVVATHDPRLATAADQCVRLTLEPGLR